MPWLRDINCHIMHRCPVAPLNFILQNLDSSSGGGDGGVGEAAKAALLEAGDGGALGGVAGDEVQNRRLEDTQRPQQRLRRGWVLPRRQALAQNHVDRLHPPMTEVNMMMLHIAPVLLKLSAQASMSTEAQQAYMR